MNVIHQYCICVYTYIHIHRYVHCLQAGACGETTQFAQNYLLFYLPILIIHTYILDIMNHDSGHEPR